ncbi:class I SAM-dependent methyltransferase [Sphingobium algorifonticola]|uniref:SAM-dependent methyltransferase n=1 Tax=Sphingobium algorifonticola TaxID=2008318 RepID=A0A437J5K9_9SPHN|nr:methyltransferase domain-containing protein [Sphingobium algorifonticola]RVT39904.1 SAM-dependent methyltransferase [Sphingobium algorifonticola]
MISNIKNIVAKKSRYKRSKLFLKLLNPSEDSTILDLGGGKGRHFASVFPFRKNVTISCFIQSNLDYAKNNYGFNTILLDGTQEKLPFEDNHFDIVFCSSVIEHVTGPKSQAIADFKSDGDIFRTKAYDYQKNFALEIQRISKRYFVQTPDKRFFVEVHSWIPLLGYLRTHNQWKVIKLFNRFWPRKDENPDWALLSVREMKEFFPDATIHYEKLFGINKSIIAVGPR